MKIKGHQAITKEGRVWRWEIVRDGEILAGGYCASQKDARNDLEAWKRIHWGNDQSEARD